MIGLALILVVVIVGASAYAVRWRPQFNPTRPTQTSQTPLEILKARYVRGEITRAEYDQMRRDLDDALAAAASQGDPAPFGV